MHIACSVVAHAHAEKNPVIVRIIEKFAVDELGGEKKFSFTQNFWAFLETGDLKNRDFSVFCLAS